MYPWKLNLNKLEANRLMVIIIKYTNNAFSKGFSAKSIFLKEKIDLKIIKKLNNNAKAPIISLDEKIAQNNSERSTKKAILSILFINKLLLMKFLILVNILIYFCMFI